MACLLLRYATLASFAHHLIPLQLKYIYIFYFIFYVRSLHFIYIFLLEYSSTYFFHFVLLITTRFSVCGFCCVNLFTPPTSVKFLLYYCLIQEIVLCSDEN